MTIISNHLLYPFGNKGLLIQRRVKVLFVVDRLTVPVYSKGYVKIGFIRLN